MINRLKLGNKHCQKSELVCLQMGPRENSHNFIVVRPVQVRDGLQIMNYCPVTDILPSQACHANQSPQVEDGLRQAKAKLACQGWN